MLYDDLEVIPTPGHTPGTTMFLWDNGEHRYLFTGDFLCFEGDSWRTVILGSSDRERSIQSLELIKTLDFDVLVPWVSIKEGPFAYFVENEEEKQQEKEKDVSACLQTLGSGVLRLAVCGSDMWLLCCSMPQQASTPVT